MRRLWSETIWAKDAIPATEGQTSWEMKRYVLPTMDALVILMGWGAITNGMPSFNLVYDAWVSSVSAWVFFLSGWVALIGLAIPRLWVLEAVGKLAMVAILGGYASALWALSLAGDGNRVFVAGGLTALLLLPLWNLARLGRERRGRRAEQQTGGD